MRATRAAAVVLAMSAAACGSDDAAGPASSAGGQATALAERAGVPAADVVEVICQGWDADAYDQATVKEYVHDLFLPLDAVNSSTPPAYSTEDIDVAVARACTAHPEDPDALLASVRSDLGLTEADLDGQIAAACERYRTQQERIAEGDWSGDDLAQLIRDLAAGRGLELAALRTAIDGVCAG